RRLEVLDPAPQAQLVGGLGDRSHVPGGALVIGRHHHRERRHDALAAQPLGRLADLFAQRLGDRAPVDVLHALILFATVCMIASACAFVWSDSLSPLASRSRTSASLIDTR